MVDDSVKFAWAYLLTHGKPTSGEWCIYGSGWEDFGGGFNWETQKTAIIPIKEEAISIGIDWDKTGIPTVSNESAFNDTYSPSTSCLATLGTLTLKNGKKYLIGSSDDDAAHLAETAREMRKGPDSEIQKLADKL